MTINLYGRSARACAVLAAVFFATLPTPVRSQEVGPDPCTEAAPVAVGTIVPCSGMLWPVSWSKRALQCVQVDLPQVNNELTRRVAEATAELQARTTTLTACREALDGCETAAEKVIAPDNPWWKHPALWAVVGVVVGGAIVGGAWAIHDRL